MNPRRSAWSTLVVLAALGTSACGGSDASPPPPTQPTGAMSDRARAYLDQVIGLMQANSVNRLTIDWNTFRSTVVAEASGTQAPADTYPAIRTAVRLLGDGHSSFRDAAGNVVAPAARSCSTSGTSTPAVPATIGYVKVPAFSGSVDEASALASGIQRAIMSADTGDVVGWIVDVRGNGGGNMWPMVAGVGPVLGEGVAGYFIDPTGGERVWEYRAGASRLGGVAMHAVDAPYRLRRERPRVAVLTDNGVASSGEAIVIAFRGRPDTRSFGVPTCGLSTANQGFPMTDGAVLSLAVSVMADRARTAYGSPVAPDELVSDPGQTVERAIAWLRTES